MAKKKVAVAEVAAPPLTPKESETLDMMVRLYRERQYPPTMEEVAAEMGCAVTTIAQRFLAFAHKGYIKRGLPRQQRTTRILLNPDGTNFTLNV